MKVREFTQSTFSLDRFRQTVSVMRKKLDIFLVRVQNLPKALRSMQRRSKFLIGFIVLFIGIFTVNLFFLQDNPSPVSLSASNADESKSTRLVVAKKIPSETVELNSGTEAPVKKLILDIQTLLLKTGHYSGPLHGKFDTPTQIALKKFQQQNTLDGSTNISSDFLLNLQAPENQGNKKFLPSRNQTGVIFTTPLRKQIKERKTSSLTSMHTITSASLLKKDSTEDMLSLPDLQKLQAVLDSFGFGPVNQDGQMGNQTSEAIKRFEKLNALPVTGRLNDQLVTAMRKVGLL